MSHHGSTAPCHVMGDILERVGKGTISDLKSLLARYRAKALKQMQKSDKDACRDLGQEYMQKAMKIMTSSKTRFKKTAHCYVCDGQCAIHPPEEIRGNALYVVAGGHTCTAWSRFGSQHGWLHESSIPFLVWTFDLLKAKPDAVIEECTALFDWEIFESIFTASGYKVERVVFSPEDEGFPCKRPRNYVLARRVKTVEISMPFELETLQKNFWKRVVSDARIFFRAPKSAVRKHMEEVARSRHLCTDAGIEYGCADLLTYSQRERLVEYQAMAERANLDFMCAQVLQNPSFLGKVGPIVPTLLCQSMIYGRSLSDEGAAVDRLLLPYEHLGVLGLPVLLPRSHPLHERLPKFLRFSSKLPSSKLLRQVAGNGMHVCQVGTVLLVLLMGSSKRQ